MTRILLWLGLVCSLPCFAGQFGFEALMGVRSFPIGNSPHSPDVFQQDYHDGYKGMHLGFNYFFSEHHGLLIEGSYNTQHMEYLDCRAPFCPKYKSDVRYPAIAVGYYLMFLEDARVWGTLGVGRGKLEFQDEAESVSAHSETVTLYRLSVKGAYRVLTPIVTIPLIFGVEYIVNPIKNFFYNGVEIEGGRVQGDPHYLIGVGAEF